MKKVVILIILISTSLLIIRCKKAYIPQLVSVSTNFLAVDGAIISGDSTIIRLSRTTKLTDTTQIKAELKATVTVENDQNLLYTLTEKGKGLYVLGATNFDKNRKYRLNVKTNDGKIYQSDFVPMKITPAIDNLYFKQTQNNELTFFADTHDDTNNTHYYRWDYKDTWAYVSLYHASYQYKNGVITTVEPHSADDINKCYRWTNSNMIIVGSSVKLSQDVIKQQPIFSITDGSEKLAHPYVIQLRQYALTKEGFEYYQNLKTNTEQLGSIFDAQPSLLKGNINCITSPTDVVLGFISASTATNKQYNLYETEHTLSARKINFGITGISTNAYPLPTYGNCIAKLDPDNPYGQGTPWSFGGPSVADLSVQPASFITRANKSLAKGDSIFFDVEFHLGFNSYLYAPKACVDCRLRGGTNIKPAYYPN